MYGKVLGGRYSKTVEVSIQSIQGDPQKVTSIEIILLLL